MSGKQRSDALVVQRPSLIDGALNTSVIFWDDD